MMDAHAQDCDSTRLHPYLRTHAHHPVRLSRLNSPSFVTNCRKKALGALPPRCPRASRDGTVRQGEVAVGTKGAVITSSCLKLLRNYGNATLHRGSVNY